MCEGIYIPAPLLYLFSMALISLAVVGYFVATNYATKNPDMADAIKDWLYKKGGLRVIAISIIAFSLGTFAISALFC